MKNGISDNLKYYLLDITNNKITWLGRVNESYYYLGCAENIKQVEMSHNIKIQVKENE
jgi:hypothetical protein